MKETKHPRLWFWLTVTPAALAAALSVYHLAVTAITLADPDYNQMLSGFFGSVYMIFDYVLMSMSINLLIFLALIFNLSRSNALGKAWNISAISSVAVFLVCGILIVLGINSGVLAVTLNLAARATAQSVTAVTLVYSLTKK